jgi:gliding motility-associated-like protein
MNLISKSLSADKPKNELQVRHQAQKYLKNQTVKFLENKGQMTDMAGKLVPFVLFKAEAPNIDLYVTEKGLTYVLFKIEEEENEHDTEKKTTMLGNHKKENNKVEWNRIDMTLKGAMIRKENIITEGTSTYFNQYFLGHCPDGILDVHTHDKITIKDIYPNIDWVLYNSNEKGFKYDFIVHSGANSQDIEMVYLSKKPIIINEQGELEITAILGNLTEHKPISFFNGQQIFTQFVQSSKNKYEIGGNKGYETSIKFSFPYLDVSQLTSDLVIDPQLVWATFYGGNSYDGPLSIATDKFGSAFITGYTFSHNLPLVNSGTYLQGGAFWGNISFFILKFDSLCSLKWATYYGGTNSDNHVNSITTDLTGNVYITGTTLATDFPVKNSGTFFQGVNAGNDDAFILKFSNNGTRLWATYYGGTLGEEGVSIVADKWGNIFVTGETGSSDFPLQNTGTFFQGTIAGYSDIFILKFDSIGNRLWGTNYGGNENELSNSISCDKTGNIMLTGWTRSTNFPVKNSGTYFNGAIASSSYNSDAFILKFDNLGNRLWGTYYGGSGDDAGHSVMSDEDGNIFVTGTTLSTNFPVKNSGTFFQGAFSGVQDIFILKFDSIGNRLWATYFGGIDYDDMHTSNNIAIDNCSNLYIIFDTQSTNLISIQSDNGGYYDNTLNGNYDMFISKFSNVGTLNWSSYIGGDGFDGHGIMAIDGKNNLFLSGEWTQVINTSSYPLTSYGSSSYYDTTFNGGLDDGYVIKFQNLFTPVLSSFQANPLSGVAPLTVNFTNTSTGSINYNWNFGDGQTSINTNPNNIFTTNGTYTVSMVASNGACNDTSSVIVIVEGGVLLEIPNVFTPNKDGLNDVFLIKVNGAKYVTLQIYNRWGLLLNESKGSNIGWDGRTTSGIEATDGTYFYIVKAVGFDDKEIEKYGFVNLFR